jgi:hypothetical protein
VDGITAEDLWAGGNVVEHELPQEGVCGDADGDEPAVAD